MAIANAESLGQKQQVIIDGAFSWCWSRSKQAQGAEGQGGQGQARVGTSSEFNFEFRSWGGLAMKIRIKASPTASLLLGFRAGRDHSSPTDGPTISLVFLVIRQAVWDCWLLLRLERTMTTAILQVRGRAEQTVHQSA